MTTATHVMGAPFRQIWAGYNDADLLRSEVWASDTATQPTTYLVNLVDVDAEREGRGDETQGLQRQTDNREQALRIARAFITATQETAA